MTYAQYYRELVRLLRGLPQNPVFLATLPWRGKLLARLWFWTNLCLAVAVVGISIAFVVSRPSTDEAAGVARALLGLSLVTPWFVAASFFASASRRWRTTHELEELYLTPCAPREIAFGLVAVPVICMFVLSAGLLAGGVVISFATTAPSERIHLIDIVAFAGTIGWFHLPTVAAAVTFNVRSGRRLWPVVIFAPFYCIGAIMLIAVTVEVFENLADTWLGWDERGLFGLAASLALLGPMMLRGAGRFAGCSTFARIEATDHAARDPLAGGRRVWWFTPASVTRAALRSCIRPTRALGPLATWLPIALLAGVACVSGLLHRTATPEFPEFRFGFFRVFNVWTLGALMIIQIISAEMAMLRRGRPIVAGAVIRSVVQPHVRVYLRHALVWCAMSAWVTFLRPVYMPWFQIVGAIVVGGFLIPLISFVASILLAHGVLANARHPVVSLLPTLSVLSVVAYMAIAIGPATYENSPVPEVNFFWYRNAVVLITVLKLLACWQLLLLPGRLTDIYTRLRIGFAEPGALLHLRREEAASA